MAVVKGVVAVRALAQTAADALDDVVGRVLAEAAGEGSGDALKVALWREGKGFRVWDG